ncbi:hypothetical protein [Microcoleus sp. CAWBG58]|uniref:hypothetical protein n=1 Tax=Microcoleus sp. CAWBG58 TaxID=2841651 RepID=UPI0025D62835|nr:hypothetical protein [Microcoleus sp. CAWBG58]
MMRDWAIALRAIMAVFGIWCEGRSLFYFRRSVIRKKKGRSHSVESSYCLVLGVKGDRLSEERKGDRS